MTELQRLGTQAGEGVFARVLAGGIVVGLSAALIVAAWLTPSEAGLGTHHQLGLPPCSLRVLLGMRCPSCGMTTSWAHFMRGNLVAAASVNTGGLLLALFALFVIPVSARLAWTGKTPGDVTLRRGTIALVGIVIITGVDWIVRLTFLS